MKYKVEFQYKEAGRSRPEDVVQDEEFIFENGESIPIPNVGDSVSYRYNEKISVFKVESRHFSYLSGWCVVNVVVTDISSEEVQARLNE
ncbi:MAG: hypothetical protein WKF90_12250 [Pyrinomonadaceae bacterium]